MLAEALDRAQAALDELWHTAPEPPHLLHGDLTPANTLVEPGGTLVPIDVQDLVLGFGVQDLSSSVLSLRRCPAGPRLVDAFRAGYTEVRPWPQAPVGLVGALTAARLLNRVNLRLAVDDPDGLPGYLADRTGQLAAWLRTPGGRASWTEVTRGPAHVLFLGANALTRLWQRRPGGTAARRPDRNSGEPPGASSTSSGGSTPAAVSADMSTGGGGGRDQRPMLPAATSAERAAGNERPRPDDGSSGLRAGGGRRTSSRPSRR
ncbi:phosphotransferase [Goekera deserti]|uniref:phosphotransferase n=1 Tax=Goekera deserti TaxID=2497753 RepID=UPI001E1AA2FD|nr:phosphotransferase [Goekera deserti]